MVSMQQTLLVWSQRTRQTEGGLGAVLAWRPTLPTCQWQIYKLCLVAKKCPLTGAVFGGRKRQTNSDTTQCTKRHVGIKDDIWPRIKVKKKKKILTLNTCEDLCASGLIAKIGILFPAQFPHVLETQRPNSVSHVSSFGCHRVWSCTGVCGRNVASTALVGQISFSVSRSNVKLRTASGTA